MSIKSINGDMNIIAGGRGAERRGAGEIVRRGDEVMGRREASETGRWGDRGRGILLR